MVEILLRCYLRFCTSCILCTTLLPEKTRTKDLESDIPLMHYWGIINILMTFVKLRMKTGLKEVFSC